MRIHPIQAAFDKLENSIKNTAREYKEGRNVLIYCLSRNSKRTEEEVVHWLKENSIGVKELDNYIIKNDTD